MKRILLTIALVACSFAGVYAQESASGTALQFGSVPRDPAAIGMGGATAFGGSTAWSALTNVASVPFSGKTFAVAGGYQMWQPSSSLATDNIGLGLAYNLDDKLGIAAAFGYGMGPEYEIFNAMGLSNGKAQTSEMMASLGVSYRFLDILSFGVSAKYLSQDLGGDAITGISADAMFTGVFNSIKVAAGVASLGSKVDSYSLPTSVVLAGAYDAVLAEKHGVKATAQMNYYLVGGLNLALGAGYTFNDLVSLRAGYNLSSEGLFPSFASLGLGLHFSGVTLDAAYLLGSEPMGGTMTFGLGYQF